jgi:predicted pyridoxine 5'-phosphate oxidase superfamily flavin-nucleotide-binding protein
MKPLDDERILIADNKMVKTLDNIQKNPKAAITFRDKDAGSYQIKGSVEYHKGDSYHDEVKQWCRKDLARKGAVVFHVEAVYNGSERLA